MSTSLAETAASVSTEAPGSTKIARLLVEIGALIEADEVADRRISGAWKTFADIEAAARAHAWDAYSVDLSADAANFARLHRRQRKALCRLFATIYRAESIVDEWMNRIVAAIPCDRDAAGGGSSFASMRGALETQEHDEKMHRSSLFRVATEVLGIAPDQVERVAKSRNNFVAETLFARFNEQMKYLLRAGRPLEDVYTAIFVYGILSEDVIANSDVIIRRAHGNDKYDEFGLPGMKEGQTNVRRDEGRHVRIAVLASRKFLAEHEGAAATLTNVAREYMDLADRMLRQAKRSYGLIDVHLRESYGSDVDALYYYVMIMKRLAVRLDELGLRESVVDIRRRVDAAIAEFADDRGVPIVAKPSRLLRTIGPAMFRILGTD